MGETLVLLPAGSVGNGGCGERGRLGLSTGSVCVGNGGLLGTAGVDSLGSTGSVCVGNGGLLGAAGVDSLDPTGSVCPGNGGLLGTTGVDSLDELDAAER